MSERRERMDVTAPKAHGCIIGTRSLSALHGTMVHQ
jgi:hypothetical protein